MGSMKYNQVSRAGSVMTSSQTADAREKDIATVGELVQSPRARGIHRDQARLDCLASGCLVVSAL